MKEVTHIVPLTAKDIAEFQAKQLRTRVYSMEGMLEATADFIEAGGYLSKTTRKAIVKDLRACERLLFDLRGAI